MSLRPGDRLVLPGIAPTVVVQQRLDQGILSVVYQVLLHGQRLVLSVAPQNSRLTQSFQLARAAQHAFVLPQYKQSSHAGFVYTLSQWAQGGALDHLLLRAYNQKIFVPLAWRIRWFEQITSAVAACHARGIAHYDVTAANVLLTGASASQILQEAQRGLDVFSRAGACPAEAKLTDFHLASRAPVADGRGTITSLAPEALRLRASGKALDSFALGCLLYVLVLGCEPYIDETEELVAKRLLKGRRSIPIAEFEQALAQEGASLQQILGLTSLVEALLDNNPTRRPSAHATLLAVQDLLR